MITPYHKEFLADPIALWLGSADANHVPEGIKCNSFSIENETTICCFFSKENSEKFRENISVNPRASLLGVNMFTFKSFQYKGEVIEVRHSTPEEEDLQVKTIDAFATACAMMGMIKEQMTGLFYFERQHSFAMRVNIDRIYEQTPKQDAGMEVTL